MKRKGFSQIEVLVALLVLTVGILSVISVFAYTFKGVEHSSQMSSALDTAQTIVELIRSRNLVPFNNATFPVEDNSGLFDSPDLRRPLNAPPFANDFPATSSFTRNVDITRLNGSAASYQYNIAVIVVRIFWNEHGAQKVVQLEAYQHQP